jgi:hypothetical protein
MAALAIILLVLLPAHQALATAAGDAHPGYAGAEADTCGPAVDDFSSFSGGAASRRQRHGPELEEYGGGRIVDITHAYMPGKPAYAPGATVGPVLRLKESMENGSEYNLSELHMECHTGTHLDAPGHFNQAHFAAGLDVDTLDLEVLNGELPCFLRPKPSFLILVFANLRSKPNLWMISVLVAGQVLRYWSMFRDTLI